MSLARTVYTSRAAIDLKQDDLREIIRVAQRNNQRDQLTGALLYLDGFFLQVLEGEAAKLMPCLDRISKDHRHSNVTIREKVAIANRAFPNQWMAIKDKDFLPPELFTAFGYEPGFPAHRFQPAELYRFIMASFG